MISEALGRPIEWFFGDEAPSNGHAEIDLAELVRQLQGFRVPVKFSGTITIGG